MNRDIISQNLGSGGSSTDNMLPASPSRFTSPSIEAIMHHQLLELRERILGYSVVSLRTNSKLKFSSLPNHSDIIVFGPSGSGKSSLIRTFYRALHEQNISEEGLVVKDKGEGEGTK